MTSKPGLGSKASVTSRQDDEQVGEQPQTWANKVKGMRKAAADINPLVAMAGKAQSSPSKLPASRPLSASAALGATRASGTFVAAAPAGGGKRPASAVGRQQAGAGARADNYRGAAIKASKACAPNGVQRSKMVSLAAKARGAGQANKAGAAGALDAEVSRNSRQEGEYPCASGSDVQGIVDGADMYARDEAIGARPKSRRGRGVSGRGTDDLQHLAEEAPLMGDDELVGRDENGAAAGGDGEPYDAYAAVGGSAYALDEAQGTRPKSRRGRGIRTRNGVSGSVDEPQMGDDETKYNAQPPPSSLAEDGDPEGDRELGGSGGLEGLPKVDEAAGIRPPSRRGRPPSRASMSTGARPSTAGGRPGPASSVNSFAAAEFGDATDAGRELFSDCTTPDAPDAQVLARSQIFFW